MATINEADTALRIKELLASNRDDISTQLEASLQRLKASPTALANSVLGLFVDLWDGTSFYDQLSKDDIQKLESGIEEVLTSLEDEDEFDMAAQHSPHQKKVKGGELKSTSNFQRTAYTATDIEPPEVDVSDHTRSLARHYAELQNIYAEKILPVETHYSFSQFGAGGELPSSFFGHEAENGEFIPAKPMVLLMGPDSVGKTTFIEYLLQTKYPGSRTEAGPATNKFIAVSYGSNPDPIPGSIVAADARKPFCDLAKPRFGNHFLERFEEAQCEAEILKYVTFIDTPGILGSSDYKFSHAMQWFIEQCDLVILMFDTAKLVASAPLEGILNQCRGYESKFRLVLNKADKVSFIDLITVYGKMMWLLRPVYPTNTEEPAPIYMGSFTNGFFQNPMSEVFLQKQRELIRELRHLSQTSLNRKITSLSKRGHIVKAHMCFVSKMYVTKPWFLFLGKASFLQGLSKLQQDTAFEFGINVNDIPDVSIYQAVLENSQAAWKLFKQLDPELVAGLKHALEHSMGKIVQQISVGAAPSADPDTNEIRSLENDREEYHNAYESVGDGGPVSCRSDNLTVRLLEFDLDYTLLDQAVVLADMDKDGYLNEREFVLCQRILASLKAHPNKVLPRRLPEAWLRG